MLLTTTPFSPGNCPGKRRPPSTTSSMRIGWLLTEVMTRLRISWIAADFLRAEDGGCLGRALERQHLVHRVQAAAEQADAPRRHGHLALGDVVATHGGVGVGQRRLELGQRDAVAAEAVGVGLNFVAAHGAAEAGEVDDPRHPPNSRSSTQSCSALISLSV